MSEETKDIDRFWVHRGYLRAPEFQDPGCGAVHADLYRSADGLDYQNHMVEFVRASVPEETKGLVEDVLDAIGYVEDADARATIERAADTIARLTRENEELQKRAENATRFARNLGEELPKSQTEVARLTSEVEVLRGALEEIKAEAPTRIMMGEWDGVTVSEIARRALEGGREDGA